MSPSMHEMVDQGSKEEMNSSIRIKQVATCVSQNSSSGTEGRVWQLCWSQVEPVQLYACSSDPPSIQRHTGRLTNGESKNGEDWSTSSWTTQDLNNNAGVVEDAHRRTIRSLSISPDARLLASASFDATTAIWDLKTSPKSMEWVATLEGHENEVKCVAFSPSGTFLATCSRDKSVWVWEVMDNPNDEDDVEFECVAVLQDHTQDVKRVLWHPAQDTLVSCSYDNDLRIWHERAGDWYCAQVLSGHASTVWDADFNRNGDRLASVSADLSCKIWAWHPDSGKWGCIQTLENLHSRDIYSVSWSKSLEIPYILTAGGDNAIRILGPSSEGMDQTTPMQLIHTLEKPHDLLDVNCVQWCPLVPGLFASAGDDSGVKIWSVEYPIQ